MCEPIWEQPIPAGMSSRIQDNSATTSGSQVTVLDGAMGTELIGRGIVLPPHLWSGHALMSAPSEVLEVHKAYLRAGATVITANTFRTNQRAVLASGLRKGDVTALTRRAVEIAELAILQSGTSECLVAGSVAPVEDCYQPGLRPNEAALESEHREFVGLLGEFGVDVILVETMNSVVEACVAVRAACREGIPVWCTFASADGKTTLSGEDLAVGMARVTDLGASAVGVNCLPAHLARQTVIHLSERVHVPIIAYANGGIVQDGVWALDPALSPDAYAELALQWIDSGAQIVGGCCGTTPAHIGAIRRAIDKQPNAQ